MTAKKVYRAIGLMSGTSLDGVDVALIETDGYEFVQAGPSVTLPYDAALRDRIRACFGKREYDENVRQVERDLTRRHVEAIKALNVKADVIGFHGQTITHDPANRFTFQIGDAALLTKETGVGVVSDFRSADVKAGGQGAPFLPLYHRARAAKLKKPLAVLNIGGVANVTWIGKQDILAFDTGPGNALIDDAVLKSTGKNFDEDGALAAGGKIDDTVLKDLLAHEFFAQKPPKSLDRNAFVVNADISALTAFTVQSIKKAMDWFPEKPREWLVAGGGRRNVFMMKELQKVLEAPVRPVDFHGWNGDALEAEGFAYLAVRSLLKEPLSLPSTTGVPRPMTGGVYTAI